MRTNGIFLSFNPFIKGQVSSVNTLLQKYPMIQYNKKVGKRTYMMGG